MRKPNELPEAFMVRMGTYFSGTAREEYYRVAKEISALRTRCSDLEKEIEQRQETEESLTQWVDDLGTELDKLKEAVKLERREMSEECPCCGEKIAINQKEGCVDCYECPFGCALAHLPRIAAAMKAESNHATLMEAVAKMRKLEEGVPSDIDEILYGSYVKNKITARAEVDRLIAEELISTFKH